MIKTPLHIDFVVQPTELPEEEKAQLSADVARLKQEANQKKVKATHRPRSKA